MDAFKDHDASNTEQNQVDSPPPKKKLMPTVVPHSVLLHASRRQKTAVIDDMYRGALYEL